MADPWTQIATNESKQAKEGAKWIITRSLALALVVLLALVALKAS
jgi:hypothetical protein